MIGHLSIDIETRSSYDIGKCGSYHYAESSDFEILLFAFSLNGAPVQVVDLAAGEDIPPAVVCELTNPDTIKHAYNAAFEWWCLNKAGYFTPISQWRCTMVHGLYLGYPAGLGAVGAALGLPEDKRKLTTGRALIRYFCTPKRGGGFHTPQDDPDKWRLFKEYNAQDVVTEQEILRILNAWPVPETEEKRWQADIKRNAYGVRVDMALVDSALAVNDAAVEGLTKTARALTGLDNPNSTGQLRAWVESRVPYEVPGITKADVEDMLTRDDTPEMVKQVLRIRQKLGKTSVAKYVAMKTAAGEGDRIRGLIQFYGANRTGRFAGRLVQVQNLPRNHMKGLDEARIAVRARNFNFLASKYDSIPDTLSQLIRTAFVPSEGNKFIVSDFSAIEARVIAWLAGEEWVTEVFRSGGDIYCATASQMFGVPVEKHGVNADLRQKGKVATLALGYQGGTKALEAMGALKMGIPKEELPEIVEKWRKANPHIVKLWQEVGDAAMAAVAEGRTGGKPGFYTFRLEQGKDLYFLTAQLPSGRKLYYPSPMVADNRFGRPAIHYQGQNQTTHKWEVASTYGGKLTENLVQAIARDCLCETIDRLEALGHKIVMHVHDEVIIDAPQSVTVDEVNAVMAQPIPWAPGLLLKGAGFESNYYMKD